MRYLVILVLASLCMSGPAPHQYETRSLAPSAPATAGESIAEAASGDALSSSLVTSRGSTTVVPNARYDAGPVWRWLFGDYYRDVWTTPLDVPVIDLERTAGGLRPLRRGGGEQTATLHLVGGDGRTYDLRSVNKDVSRSIPDAYRAPFVGYVVQDQMSALHPLAAQIAAPLARAAGILYLDPVLVMIPDSPRLGAFREEFGGMLALFERDPDEDQSDAARFGFAGNVVGTEKLFEELREDSADRVDERAYARARLFDMLIGDWDRHDGQWRWSEFETQRGKRFVAVPTDRDVAFSKFDGFLTRLIGWTGIMTFRRLSNFDEDISDVFGLNWQGRWIDRQIATGLTRRDWVEIADSLRLAMSDEVIDLAVRTWPDPVFDLVGPMTARNLKSRREDLPSVASRFYDLLAERVDVHGSDLDERFEITRLGSDETRVVMLKISPGGGPACELYRRTFLRNETEEIRISGVGGNDQIILYGKADGGTTVRIRGGRGTTAFIDSSALDGPSRLGVLEPVRF